MIPIKSHDYSAMKTLYSDPTGSYKLVQFNNDSDNLEVIIFRKSENELPIDTEEKVDDVSNTTESTGLIRRCLGFLIDPATGIREKWEIDSEGVWSILPSGGKGRPPKDFVSKGEFIDYWNSLRIDSSKGGKNLTVKSTGGTGTGWWRIPCYCTSIETGLFKVIEYALQDKMIEAAKDAQEFRSILKEFKEDIRRQFNLPVKRIQ